jgi:hypothetical protein
VQELAVPENSGGLLAALTVYRRLLLMGAEGFKTQFSHGGTEPVYLPREDGKPITNGLPVRVDCAVIRTSDAGISSKWYFHPKTRQLLACECKVLPEADPCEVFFSNYQVVDGRQLPHTLMVRWGERNYGTLTITNWSLKP